MQGTQHQQRQSINIIHGGSASKLSHLDDLYWTLWPPMLQWLTYMVCVSDLCIWLTRISQDSDPTLAYEILLLIHKGAGEIIEGLPTFVRDEAWYILHPKKSFRWKSMPPAHWFNTPGRWRKVIPAYLINTTHNSMISWYPNESHHRFSHPTLCEPVQRKQHQYLLECQPQLQPQFWVNQRQLQPLSEDPSCGHVQHATWPFASPLWEHVLCSSLTWMGARRVDDHRNGAKRWYAEFTSFCSS